MLDATAEPAHLEQIELAERVAIHYMWEFEQRSPNLTLTDDSSSASFVNE